MIRLAPAPAKEHAARELTLTGGAACIPARRPALRRARRTLGALCVLTLVSITACGVRLRNPIQTGPDPAAPAPPSPPETFVRSTSDTKSTRLIEVREGMKKDVAFKAVTDVLAQKYTVDVSDLRAGFLMTAWQSSVGQSGVPDLRYRVRVVVRFLGAGDEVKQASVRTEANWQRMDEWDVGYDVAALEAVAAELRTVLGKRPEVANPTPIIK